MRSRPVLFKTSLNISSCAADIPLNKLDSKEFQWFCQQYTDFRAPNREHARKTIAPRIFNDSVTDAKNQLKDDKIYVSIDETTDKKGEKVAACIVGSLTKQDIGPFLVNLQCLKQGTVVHLYEFLINSLNILDFFCTANQLIIYMYHLIKATCTLIFE